MEEALALFRKVYQQHRSIETCIAELKRKGFSQMTAVRVIMEVCVLDAVEADELVYDSVTWRTGS